MACCGPVKLPNHHMHALLSIIAYIFFPFPFLSSAISACRPEKRLSMESCQDSSAPDSFVNICQKNPTSSLNFVKCNKGTSPFLLCPKPLADVEVFSNVSLLALSWGASAHFLPNLKNSFPWKLAPITTLKDKQGGRKKGASLTWKDHCDFTALDWVKN